MANIHTAGDLAREFAFSDGEFQKLSQQIYARAGIHITASKKDMVYSRLARRLRANQLNNFSDYIALLESNHAQECEAFVNALTTNVTAFFRESHHFGLLADHISTLLPRQNFKIWCSAASTGQEPYSIAMTMMDLFNTCTPPVEIIASDIDTAALKKASAGIYTLEEVKGLAKAQLQRYFLKGRGQNTGHVKVRDELRNMVRFSQLNLLDAHWRIQGPFDAIFCRNVMIYFDKPTQYRILEKFIPMMRQDGLMFAGHSENLQNMTELFKLNGKTVYRIADKAKIFANVSASNTL